MTTRPLSAGPRPYDWRKALGEIPPPASRKPGQTQRAHPLTNAIRQKEYRKVAIRVLTRALEAAEGRVDWLATLLECSWHVASRLVQAAGLRELGGTLRLENGHPGPTGHGISPRKKASYTRNLPTL